MKKRILFIGTGGTIASEMSDEGLLPGVGTLITALFMGPLIEVFNHSFSLPFLYGKGNVHKLDKGSASKGNGTQGK